MAQAAAAADDRVAEQAAEDGAGEVRLGGRYGFRLERPLPELDSPRARAYLAFDQRFPTRLLFALVCAPGLPHRGDVLTALTGQPTQNWLGVAHAGVVTTPGGDERRVAAILERPEGGRLWPSIASPGPPLAELEVSHRVVPALAAALADLEYRHVAHGAIRPDNLFFLDEERRYAALGECFSEPSGLSQPTAFEPIERGLAMPLARGEGTPSSDLYSFGVTVLALLLGNDPALDRDDDELSRDKLIDGSFAALVDERQFSNRIRILLRGLLSDDPEHRWSADQVLEWCESPRANPKRTPKARRAPHPFSFADKDYYYPQVLAMEMAREPRQAAAEVRGDKLESWLRRELHDAESGEQMVYIAGLDNLGDDEVTARACLALDPKGPIRYRGLRVLPAGLGTVLASAYAEGDKAVLQVVAELLGSGLPALWGEHIDDTTSDFTAVLRSLRELKELVTGQDTGAGLERCLYELNPALPCRGPLVAEALVLTPRQLLAALEAAVAKGVETDNLLDRHVTAFIASRLPQVRGLVRRLAHKGADKTQRILAILALLAELQLREPQVSLPNICAWIGSRLEPALAIYHSAIRRQALAEKIKAIQGDGDLTAIQALIGGGASLDRDEAEYREAKREHAANQREIEALKSGGAARHRTAIGHGQRAAAGAGSLILALTVGYLLVHGLW